MDAKEILNSLKESLKLYSESIREVSKEIIGNEVSQYPVFIAHQEDIALGELILDRNDFDTDWSISVTTVEELVSVNVIQKNKKSSFLKVYKPASTHICILLISEKGANFIFQPF